ncbi:MAG: hypothetical protein JKY56_21120 [Kofleriaceae bacterium]|nr:hypothetical protein [Kofleriaceae bacterium]
MISTSTSEASNENAMSQDPQNFGVGSRRSYELSRMSSRQLEALMKAGTMPDLASLAGWEFRGLNHPSWAKMAGIKKFMKGFFNKDEELFGYNCATVQNSLVMPWLGKPDNENPKRFGFYLVDTVDPAAKDNCYPNAVLLDYGRGGNKPYDPTRGLRDYLVQVDSDNPDLYLGKAYYALGPLRVATSFFILERHRRA